MDFEEWLREFFDSTKFTFIDNFDEQEKSRRIGALWAIETIIEYYKLFEKMERENE